MKRIARLLALVAVIGGLAMGQAQKKGNGRRPPPPPPAPEKYSLSRMIELLDVYSRNPTLNIDEIVRSHGIDFVATPNEVKVLRELGATDSLLKLIPQTPPPPPPPPDPTATLNLTCDIGNCEVVVNDVYYGMAVGGKISIPELKPGPARIVYAFAAGYQKATAKVDLKPDLTATETLKFKPSLDKQRSKAQQQLLTTINALGGFQGIELLQSLPGNGKVELKGKDLKGGTLEFTLELNPSGRSFVLHGEGNSVCRESLLTNPGEPDCKGKKLPPNSDVLAAAAMFRDSSLSAMLSKFTEGELSVREGNSVLENKGTADTFELALNGDSLPVSLTQHPNGNSEASAKVEFADYADFQKFHYPRKITVMRTAPNPATATFTLNLSALPPASGGKKK